METERNETQFILVNPVSTTPSVNSGIYSHQGCTTVIPKNSVSLNSINNNQRSAGQALMTAMPVSVVLSPTSYKKQMESNLSVHKSVEMNKSFTEPKHFYQVASNVNAIQFPKHLVNPNNCDSDQKLTNLQNCQQIDTKVVESNSVLNSDDTSTNKVNGDSNHENLAKDHVDSKMDLNKLDETINSVLVLARSDEPCEGLFVLPNRRESVTSTIHTSSQPPTPTSQQNSPRPNVTSPHFQSQPTTTIVSNSSVSTNNNKTYVTTSRNMPRYIVDQMPGNFQFVSGVPQQPYPYAAATPTVPTVVQVYPENCVTSGSHVQVNQHAILSQLGHTVRSPIVSSAAPTSMIIRPGVIHNVQQRQIIGVPQSLATLATLHRTTQASIISSVKINTSAINNGMVNNHQVAFPMSIVSNSVNQPNVIPSRSNSHLSVASTSRATVTANSAPTNICIIRKPVNQTVPGGNLICRQTAPQIAAAGIAQYQLNKDSSAINQVNTNTVIPNSNVSIISSSSFVKDSIITAKSTFVDPVNNTVTTQSVPLSVNSINCKPIVAAKPLDNGVVKPNLAAKKRTMQHSNSSGTTKRRKINTAHESKIPITSGSVSLPQQNPLPSPVKATISSNLTSKNVVTTSANNNDCTPRESPGFSSQSQVSLILKELKSCDPKSLIANPPVQSFDIILPPLGSSNGTTCLPSYAKEMSSLRNRGLKYRRELFSVPVPKPTVIKDSVFSSSFDVQDEYLCQHLAYEPPVNLLSRNENKKDTFRVAASPTSDDVDRSSFLPSLTKLCSDPTYRDSTTPPLLTHHPIKKTCDIKSDPLSNSSCSSSENGTSSKTQMIRRECLRISFAPQNLFLKISADVAAGIATFFSLPVNCVTVDTSNNSSDVVIKPPEKNGTYFNFTDSVLKQLGLYLKHKFLFISVHFSIDTIQLKKFTSIENEKIQNVGSNSMLHQEEPLSFTSLSMHNKTKQRELVCTLCVSPIKESNIYVPLLDFVKTDNVSMLSVRPGEENSLLHFCTSDCLDKFTQCLLDVHNKLVKKCSENTLATNNTTINDVKTKMVDNSDQNVPVNNENQLVTQPVHSTPSVKYHLTCDKISQGLPVVLQPMTSKLTRQLQKPLVCYDACFNSKSTSMLKKWQGTRWLRYSPNLLTQTNRYIQNKSGLSSKEFHEMIIDEDLRLQLPSEFDSRKCLLCNKTGDLQPNGPGRLLPYDVDKWIHLNCILWCFEVYESVSGSLHNVDYCIKKALKTKCSHCFSAGAGLPCYNPRCNSIYHVPCALEIGCMFFTDRGMYCPLHQPKDHPMQLKSLGVTRKVYITRDENSQVAKSINSEDLKCSIRIGGAILKSLGQLLPHQIESGNFHSKRHIYPVGFVSMRTYWSMRKAKVRSLYINGITEKDNKPLFFVKEILKDFEDEEVVADTCDGVWKLVLERIACIRLQNGLIKVFPSHIRGEVMFGLTETHIIRAVESLPGVESLSDYCFNFGRMELISGMPLAINPSGCARSEPRMKTSIKHGRRSVSSGEASAGNKLTPSKVGITTCRGRRANSILSLESKSSLASKSQQYRRLKSDVNTNVILGRSRIQGFGLLAARDLEANTMVIEYIGELIRIELANKREKEYEAHNRGIYMFRLDDNTVIDATMTGGLARYINHSCSPNCFTEYVNFGEDGHIVIMTNQKVLKGEELSYDYKFDFEDGTDKIPCLCGAANCRKWMN